jgi:putative ATP-dependent endonuclease of OLD family
MSVQGDRTTLSFSFLKEAAMLVAEEHSPPTAPSILRLTVERFRGIKSLKWYPSSGVNLVLGGGDVGKSAILDAIALLLAPTNGSVLSDADYWQRNPEEEFSIEAVIRLPDGRGINTQSKPAWPWNWDGKDPQLPELTDDGQQSVDDPVYRIRLRGSADFDLVYEVIQPNGQVDHLSVAVRRAIGIVRLGGDDRNDRDLRMVQGSALDRLLYDKTLRARLGHKVAETDVEAVLQPEAKAKIEALDKAFTNRALPNDLGLGIATNQSQSLNALIGLTADKDGVDLPLASWGSGTRRIAALEVASANQDADPIVVVDEVERGLEPYRLRALLRRLQNGSSQVFLTTHSATTLRALSKANLWLLDSAGNVGSLSEVVIKHATQEPEALLSRLTILCEGKTEVGFVRTLLRRDLGMEAMDHGVWLANVGGNEQTLLMLEALSKSGLLFGGFADDEGTSPDRWATQRKVLGQLLFRWSKGCTESNVIQHIADEDLPRLIRHPELEGERLRILADRAGIDDKSIEAIKKARPDFRQLIIEAATCFIPEDTSKLPRFEVKAWKRHGERWFKSEDGGQELAIKAVVLKALPALGDDLPQFIAAVRATIGVPAKEQERT